MMFTHCGYKNTAAMGKRNEDIYAEGRNAGLQIKLCFRKLPYHELKLYFTFLMPCVLQEGTSVGEIGDRYPEGSRRDR